MARQYFVATDTDTLYEDGDSETLRFVRDPARKGEAWIEVKRKLNYGEQQRLLAGLIARMPLSALAEDADPDALDVSVATSGVESIAAWVVGWSFRDAGEKAVAVSRAAIEALDPEVADAIKNAITAQVAQANAEKKAPSGPRRGAGKSR